MEEATLKRIEEIQARLEKHRAFGRMDRDDREFLDRLREDAKWLILQAQGVPTSIQPRPKKSRG